MSAPTSDTVAVLGAGISGLSVAWYLKRKGFEVTLFEAEKSVGGVINSEPNEYSVFDFGPNTIRDKTGSVSQMITELGLNEETLSISEFSKVRFIVRNGELKAISQNPFSLLFSDVLSLKGKKSLFSEPFRKALESKKDESVGAFLERRIGKESVKYLADPFFSGIYAGDIYSMSKHKLMGKLAEFEQKYGSIFKGFLKNRKSKSGMKPQVVSFKQGVQQLTNTLSSELASSTKFEIIEHVEMQDSKFQISTDQNNYEFDRVVSCLPAYALEKVLSTDHKHLKESLSEINYPSMLSTQVVFKKEDLNLPEKGFGFLVPRKEQFRLLGAIWKSNIFPEQTKEDFVHVNLMTGGAHDSVISEIDIEEVEEEVLSEFKQIMNTEAHPIFISSKLWRQSIPQFKVGHGEIDKLIDEFEFDHKRLHIGGNFRWGVSVSDCIEGAKELAETISEQ